MSIIEVFTDGACTSNGKKFAKGGIGIYFPNGEHEPISEQYVSDKITNQRAELYAIYKALLTITQKIEYKKIVIYTDSEYSINCVTKWVKLWVKNNWRTASNKPVLNIDIIKPIYEILNNNKRKVKFIHVRSHTGNTDYKSLGNHMADTLATSGIVQ